MSRSGALRHWEVLADQAITEAVRSCQALERPSVATTDRDRHLARLKTSEHALEVILSAGGDVSDVRTSSDLTNAEVFNAAGLPQSVRSAMATASREAVDASVRSLLAERGYEAVDVTVSGHFRYPAYGFMGWHTNSRVPGHRAYVTWVETPGRSWFRYRDPDSGRIHTSLDAGCDLRIFPIAQDRAFWHCVYSEVERFSFGYRLSGQDQ